MNISDKWTKYLIICFWLFGAFLLEYFSLFVIEMWIFKMDIWHYTTNQRSVHHLIMVVLWTIYLISILAWSNKKLSFPRENKRFAITPKNLIVAIICLIACKVMTFIDWHTLKVIGEASGKNAFQFITQYMYYVMEVGIVLLIIMFGQKAFEVRINKESSIPFGGIVLALTWGIFHFVSRGVGLEIWNGISCVLFSILSGIMYLKLGRSSAWSYLFIAIGYLL